MVIVPLVGGCGKVSRMNNHELVFDTFALCRLS
jgi:hypothetical protein